MGDGIEIFVFEWGVEKIIWVDVWIYEFGFKKVDL